MPENKNPQEAEKSEDEENMGYDNGWMEGEIPTWMLMKKFYKLKAKIARLEGMMEVMLQGHGSHGCSCMHGNFGGATHACSCGCSCCGR